jgi:arylsulfatase A-like enzyme
MIRSLLPLVLGTVPLATPLPAAPPAAARPNILMIVIDDLNDWIGALGGHPNALTPRMDQLAAQGTLFTNAHAIAPLCGPTRAALLTGLSPAQTGLYGHAHYHDIKANPVTRDVELLPAYFSRHGYLTLATGKIFHEGSPTEAFDRVGQAKHTFGPYPPARLNYTPPGGSGTLTDWGAFPATDVEMPDYENTQWAVAQLGKKWDQPFFLSIGYIRPHVPFLVPPAWFDLHPLEQVQLPRDRPGVWDELPATARRFADLPQMPSFPAMSEGERWRESVQAYLACVSFVDHYVGVVLDALEASPHADNTIVVLFSDHGYHLGEKGLWAKHTLWEESTRIPLIIVTPEQRRGQQPRLPTSQPVSQLDLYPTLVDLAGLPRNPANQGRSLAPLLHDPEAPGFDAIVTTHGYGNHAVRTARWRYIRYEDSTEELYDHWHDQPEWHNLASAPELAHVVTSLRTYLPAHNAPWDPRVVQGSHYNDYMRELFDRSRADR